MGALEVMECCAGSMLCSHNPLVPLAIAVYVGVPIGAVFAIITGGRRAQLATEDSRSTALGTYSAALLDWDDFGGQGAARFELSWPEGESVALQLPGPEPTARDVTLPLAWLPPESAAARGTEHCCDRDEGDDVPPPMRRGAALASPEGALPKAHKLGVGTAVRGASSFVNATLGGQKVSAPFTLCDTETVFSECGVWGRLWKSDCQVPKFLSNGGFLTELALAARVSPGGEILSLMVDICNSRFVQASSVKSKPSDADRNCENMVPLFDVSLNVTVRSVDDPVYQAGNSTDCAFHFGRSKASYEHAARSFYACGVCFLVLWGLAVLGAIAACNDWSLSELWATCATLICCGPLVLFDCCDRVRRACGIAKSQDADVQADDGSQADDDSTSSSARRTSGARRSLRLELDLADASRTPPEDATMPPEVVTAAGTAGKYVTAGGHMDDIDEAAAREVRVEVQ